MSAPERAPTRSYYSQRQIVNNSTAPNDRYVQLTCALPRADFAKLDALARERNVARSVLARELIASALENAK